MLRANNPVGFRLPEHFDPYLWRHQIKTAYLVALGATDELAGLGAPNSVMSAMTGDETNLAIYNVRHTWISEKHQRA